MKKIYNWFINLSKDKLLHAIASMVITMVATIIFAACGGGHASAVYGWAAGFVVGLAKELYDEIVSKSSESSDWAADLAATTFATIYALVYSFVL